MKNNSMIITIVLAAVFALGGFFAGMQYQKSQRITIGAGQFAGRFGAGRGAGANGTALRGQIISADNGSITVKLADGSSKIILFSNSTNVTEATSAGTQALQNGKQVMVFGTSNSDGSVTAQSIQLNPLTRRGARGG